MQGNFLSQAGEEAIRLFLDERKVTFEAVASANDEMILGAMTALRERGIRVPDDISVVGFDDLEEGRYSLPPLTTIRQPLYEQGRRAAEMLLALLAGENVPERVALPTEMVVRQSCGCFPKTVQKESKKMQLRMGKTSKVTFNAQQARIISEMVKAANISAVHLNPGWAGTLLDAFFGNLAAKPRDIFLPALDDILRQVGAEGDDVMQWHRVLDVLRYQTLPSLTGGRTLAKANALYQRAAALIGEIAQWAQANRRIQANRSAFDFTIGISEPLMTAFDVAGLTDVVIRQLPKMGITSCYLAVYERPGERKRNPPTEWSRLIIAYNRDGQIKLEEGGQRFPSHRLVPDGILSQERRYALLLESLHFRDEIQLGFMLSEPLHAKAGVFREALSRQISIALKGALLLQERTVAQKALQKSEKKYRSLLEFNHEILKNAAIGIIRMDTEMRIQYENPELERIIGLPTDTARSRAMGMDIRKIPGIQGAGLVPHLDDLQKGKEIILETAFTSIYGKKTFVRITGSPIREKNRVVGSVLLVEDISERKQSEQALHESEERYRAVIETTDTGYMVLDEQGRVVDANLNYVRLTGHSSVAEILGRQVVEWTAPHDLERNRDAVLKCFAEGCVQNLEIDYRHPDGTIVPVEINANVVQTMNGKRIVTLCRDITERKQTRDALAASEERYRSLAEASHDMIFIIGEEGVVEYVNEFASRQFGLRQELIVGMHMGSLFSTDVAERQYKSISRVIASGIPGYIESPSGFPGGERWLGTWLVPLRDKTGRSTSVMGVSRDITDRIQVDQALKEYSERLEEMVEERTAELRDALQKVQMADQLKSEFIANVNHELRTPLTNLVLYHQILRADPAVKTQERLDVIGREIQRLRILIEDMLKISHLDTGQAVFRPMPQDLNRIIKTLVSDRSTIAEESGITLTIELEPSLPSVWLDEAMVVQVISNLMTNAMNYTPAGGQVHISTRRLEDRMGKSGVAFTVQDTGPGVSQEDLPHLFERFYRGKAGHAAGVPGTGLGLAIVKEVVERHHGRIDVGNVVDGHGAVFTVWLPVEQGQETG